MQGISIDIKIGDGKGLLGKSLPEIQATPRIAKKKKKKKSLLKQVLESTIPVKPKYEVDTI